MTPAPWQSPARGHGCTFFFRSSVKSLLVRIGFGFRHWSVKVRGGELDNVEGPDNVLMAERGEEMASRPRSLH